MKMEQVVKLYGRWVQPLLPMAVRKVIRMAWGLWGYWPILLISEIGMGERIGLIRRFLRVDNHVEHAHWPCEIAHITRALFASGAGRKEIMVEAGCWKGGSTAKFSILCKKLDLRLFVYDSFQGVEPSDQDGYDYSGEYGATRDLVANHVSLYGEIDVCTFIAGWFSDTISKNPLSEPIRAVYIDCDLAKGTQEVLTGVMDSLVDDGLLWTQDFHIEPVRRLLHDPKTWEQYSRYVIDVEFFCHNLARLKLGRL